MADIYVDYATGDVTLNGWSWYDIPSNIHAWINYSNDHKVKTSSQIVVERGLGDENPCSYFQNRDNYFWRG